MAKSGKEWKHARLLAHVRSQRKECGQEADKPQISRFVRLARGTAQHDFSPNCDSNHDQHDDRYHVSLQTEGFEWVDGNNVDDLPLQFLRH